MPIAGSPVHLAINGPAAPDGGADVTDQLKAMIAGNSLSLLVNDDHLKEIISGSNKSLRVYYSIDGAAGMRTAREDRLLTITAAPGKRLVIRNATYGVLRPAPDKIARGDIGPPEGVADVTQLLRGRVTNNSLTIAATNGSFGDPCAFVIKKLRIEYSIDGSRGVRTTGEDQVLTIAADKGKTLRIERALYGDLPGKPDVLAAGDIGHSVANPMSSDVTRRLHDAIVNNRLSVDATNDAMGGDPAPFITKRLTVSYTVAGHSHQATAAEGGVLKLPAPGDGDGTLAIVKATWGPP